MDIHNYKGQLERTVERVRESTDISDSNKKIILEFKDYLFSEGIGLAKINRYLIDTAKYARILGKPIKKSTKDDVRKAVAEIEQTNLAAETKKGFKIMSRYILEYRKV